MPDAPPPVIREGARFRGLVVLREPARVDGRVDGEILARGAVWIGAGAHVRARIEAAEVVVAGRVEGTVAARRVELLPTAHVSAEVVTPRLVLAEGSTLEGRCRSGAEPAARAPASA